jgi:hypothetical protein
MKKIKIIAVILIIVMSFQTHAQGDYEHLMKRHLPSCREIAYNSTYLFEKYISNREQDSAYGLLMYWQSKCPMNEYMQIAKIIYALEYNAYSDSIIDTNFYTYFSYFHEDMETKHAKPDVYAKDIFHYFNDFTLYETQRLESKFYVGSVGYLLCKAFEDDSTTFGNIITSTEYKGTKLNRLYEAELKDLNNDGLYTTVFTGIWMPYGKAQILGNHPLLGFQIGTQYNNLLYYLNFECRFGDAANRYLAYHKNDSGTWDSTKYFFGINLCLEVAKPFYENNKIKLELIGGMGYDGFSVFSGNDNNYYRANKKSTTAASFTCNGGIGFKHHLGVNNFIGCQLKYNVVNYTMNNIVNFTGNSISLRLIYGGLMGDGKRKMKLLQDVHSDSVF